MAEPDLRASPALVSPSAVSIADRSHAPRTFHVSHDGTLRQDLTPHELLEVVESGNGELWVDIDARDLHQHAVLEKVFRFHPLSIEDTLNPATRVKLEEYDRYLFIVLHAVALDDTTEDPFDLRTTTLYYFLGPNYLVTVHGEHAVGLTQAFEHVTRHPEFLRRGAERILHALMDSVVDAFFPIVDRLDEFVSEFDERVFVAFDPDTMRDIFAVKRMVVALRRHLMPQREVFNVLTNRPNSLLSPESQLYFRDIYDHVLRINDTLESFREILSGTLDAYLTQVSNRLNVATKGLTVVATLSVPFVVISGMWGMNFDVIPLSGHPWGFWLLLGIQAAIGVGLLTILRLRRWL